MLKIRIARQNSSKDIMTLETLMKPWENVQIRARPHPTLSLPVKIS